MHAEAIKSQDDFKMNELKEIIKKLANKKAPGHDRITTELIKSAGNGLLDTKTLCCGFLSHSIF